MNDSEHDNIASEVLTDFGRLLGRPTLDRRRLREVLTTTVAQHADQPAIAGLRESGAHYYAVPSDGNAFELRLGHHELAMLNPEGAVPGEFVSVAVVTAAELEDGASAR
jgi:hypothetical protein